MAQGDGKSDVASPSIPGGSWGYYDIRPAVGETWKVQYVKLTMPSGVAGARVGLALSDGTLSLDIVPEVGDTNPSLEFKDSALGELFITNTCFLRARAFNSAVAIVGMEVILFALQIK